MLKTPRIENGTLGKILLEKATLEKTLLERPLHKTTFGTRIVFVVFEVSIGHAWTPQPPFCCFPEGAFVFGTY